MVTTTKLLEATERRAKLTAKEAQSRLGDAYRVTHRADGIVILWRNEDGPFPQIFSFTTQQLETLMGLED